MFILYLDDCYNPQGYPYTMKKKISTLLIIILLAANVFFYLNFDKYKPTEKPQNSSAESDFDKLGKFYLWIFAAVILISILFLITFLIKRFYV